LQIVIGFGEKSNIEGLRAEVLGWPVHADVDDDTLYATRHIVAVTGDGNVVGAVSCSLVAFPNGDGANFGASRAVRFWGLAVDPRFQYHGIGTQLMGAVKERAYDLDARVLWAYARHDAVPFYEHMGFDVFEGPKESDLSGLPNKRVALHLRDVG
jgi:GNAT superfamily N-acetyltransferase